MNASIPTAVLFNEPLAEESKAPLPSPNALNRYLPSDKSLIAEAPPPPVGHDVIVEPLSVAEPSILIFSNVNSSSLAV